MILGLGTDLVHMPRIGRALDRWGPRFLERVYTEPEIELCMARHDPVQCLAIRFAAKEACSKALGTGMRQGVSWIQMAVTQRPSGRPLLELTGRALEVACSLGATSWHVSLTHEGEYANAVVILEGDFKGCPP